MRNSKIKFIAAGIVIIVITGFILARARPRPDADEVIKQISPVIGTIENFISTTGTVLPKNRLQIKPPVNGRVESILVREGDRVKTGQVLAWMSSTERAALLDAARGQGEQQLKYWQEVYKPIALLAPIDGEVIVATTQPGQTVTTADAVLVLSDHLIVRAQVDETDIGKITAEQKALISLDAYPDVKISASVEHIYYESVTVNNVTIYNVDLLPEEVPLFFRSGMNVTINFIQSRKQDILTLPVDVVRKDKDESYVFLKKKGVKELIKQAVKLGISDDKNVEIISGVGPSDIIVTKSKKFMLPKSSQGNSPFTPFGRRSQPGR